MKKFSVFLLKNTILSPIPAHISFALTPYLNTFVALLLLRANAVLQDCVSAPPELRYTTLNRKHAIYLLRPYVR